MASVFWRIKFSNSSILEINKLSDNSEKCNVQIFGFGGQTMFLKEVRVFPGKNEVNIDFEGVPNGLYNLQVTTNENTLNSIIVKQERN